MGHCTRDLLSLSDWVTWAPQGQKQEFGKDGFRAGLPAPPLHEVVERPGQAAGSVPARKAGRRKGA